MPKQRTKADMAALRAAITEILRADHPQTVRQVFYQLVVRGAVQKTETEYTQTVSRLLGEMRLAGELNWSWVVDNSRRTTVTRTFDNVGAALEDSGGFIDDRLCVRVTFTLRFGARRRPSPAFYMTPPRSTTFRWCRAGVSLLYRSYE
jgi:hypothetical protein